MALQNVYNPRIIQGTQAELEAETFIYDENDLLLTTDTNPLILKKGNNLDVYANLPPIGGGGGEGMTQSLTKGPGIGQIGITSGNNITINTIAADGSTSESPDDIDIGGTGAQVFDMIGASGLPGGTEGLLVHFQRQGADGNGEFQFFSSDEANFPGLYARWKNATNAWTPYNLLATHAWVEQNTVQSIVAGANITVDASDTANPIISASGGGTVGTLEAVTGNGNSTPNGIQITGDAGIVLATDGLAMYSGSGTSTLGNLVGGSLTSALTLEAETGTQAGAAFGGRVSGQPAINPGDYVTLSQTTLDAVTTQGNSTANAIQVTGQANLTTGTDGIAMHMVTAGNAILANYVGGAISSSVVLETGELVLSASSTSVIVGPQDGTNAGAQFSGRASGSSAINAGDFTTLAQLNAAGTAQATSDTIVRRSADGRIVAVNYRTTQAVPPNPGVTSLDFDSDGIKVVTYNANASITLLDPIDGCEMTIKATNTTASTITLTFTGEGGVPTELPAGVDGSIAANSHCVFSIRVMNGVISMTKVQY